MLGLVLANLNRMRARVALTAVGVVIGTAAVVLLVSLSVGLQENLASEMSAFGDLTLIDVSPGSGRTERGGREAAGRRIDLEALDEMAEVEGVRAVTPRVTLQGALRLRWGRESTYAPYVQGIEPRAAEQMGWTLQSGHPRLGRGQVVVGPELFGSGEFAFLAAAGSAVVGAGDGGVGEAPERVELQGRTLVAELTRYDDQGKEATRGERLRVVGVFEPSGGINDVAIYMARSDVEAYNQWVTGERRAAREGFEAAVVKVEDPADVRQVQAAIDDMGFTTFSSLQIAEAMGQVFLIVRLVLGGIGAVALLVAAFGIANTMTMAIYERTKEIGIMKAVGATSRDILRIFLGEAGAIGALGGLFGVLLGGLGGKGINFALQLTILRSQQATAQPVDQDLPSLLVTPPWLAAFAVAFAVLVGLASGIYPALRAAGMKPLHALRME